MTPMELSTKMLFTLKKAELFAWTREIFFGPTKFITFVTITIEKLLLAGDHFLILHIHFVVKVWSLS